MRNIKLVQSLLISIVASTVVMAQDNAEPTELGKETYAVCSACHLASGDGVPGAFPAIKNRLAGIAKTDEGRDYLLSVVLNGLSGSITVAEIPYNGYMLGLGATLSGEKISAVLNYVATELNDDQSSDGFELFTQEEVRKARARHAQSDAAGSYKLRSELEL